MSWQATVNVAQQPVLAPERRIHRFQEQEEAFRRKQEDLQVWDYLPSPSGLPLSLSR